MTTPQKILYIEVGKTLQDVFTHLFELKTDYQFNVAHTGHEGIRQALELQPDLILMGLRLPGLDGFQVIERLRSHPKTQSIPIIVLSPWSDAHSKERAFQAGANEHITPPVEIDYLVHRVSSYL